jgi:hypothetical protein
MLEKVVRQVKHITIIGLALLAGCILSGLATSVAVAAPEFKASCFLDEVGKYSSQASCEKDEEGGSGWEHTTVKGLSAGMKLRNTSTLIACTAGSIPGGGFFRTFVTRLLMHWLKCEATSEGKPNCKVNSPGAGEGEIVSNTLKGELGEVAASEATSKRGLLLKPETGKALFTVEKAACITFAGSAEGSIAGEISPVGKSQTTSKLVFVEAGTGKQQIKQLTVKPGKSEAPSLTFGFLSAAEEATDDLAFDHAIEVT